MYVTVLSMKRVTVSRGGYQRITYNNKQLES